MTLGSCGLPANSGKQVAYNNPACEYAKQNLSPRWKYKGTNKHPTECGSCPEFIHATQNRKPRRGFFNTFLVVEA